MKNNHSTVTAKSLWILTATISKLRKILKALQEISATTEHVEEYTVTCVKAEISKAISILKTDNITKKVKLENTKDSNSMFLVSNTALKDLPLPVSYSTSKSNADDISVFQMKMVWFSPLSHCLLCP